MQNKKQIGHIVHLRKQRTCTQTTILGFRDLISWLGQSLLQYGKYAGDRQEGLMATVAAGGEPKDTHEGVSLL